MILQSSCFSSISRLRGSPILTTAVPRSSALVAFDISMVSVNLGTAQALRKFLQQTFHVY